MEKPLNADPTPVPDAKWVETVNLFTERLGKPHLSRDGAPVDSVEKATDAIWGHGEAEVHLHRGDKGAELVAVGSSTFFKCDTRHAFEELSAKIKKIYPEEAELQFNPIEEHTDPLLGPKKIIIINFKAFYINRGHGKREGYELAGKADILCCVIHNPPI
ncbi:hypothetical protein [Hymenobacter sp. PAMC 26628]|uniref:hypothetical protein n=1 Tax=Hymenobacter sp. PAMC 26628 TaxID=1484118 RepID=UPI0007706A92|nr:hypothetical protein [Hymenobacter sp. PAMC 26628]AMJ65237.1 hypothetical protein AXW84_07210 [Hymenobacter sp. PAMC 26628]